ncbi:MAG: hypothetical protein V9F82_14405 [Dermatophilaceae bacterium]
MTRWTVDPVVQDDLLLDALAERRYAGSDPAAALLADLALACDVPIGPRSRPRRSTRWRLVGGSLATMAFVGASATLAAALNGAARSSDSAPWLTRAGDRVAGSLDTSQGGGPGLSVRTTALMGAFPQAWVITLPGLAGDEWAPAPASLPDAQAAVAVPARLGDGLPIPVEQPRGATAGDGADGPADPGATAGGQVTASGPVGGGSGAGVAGSVGNAHGGNPQGTNAQGANPQGAHPQGATPASGADGGSAQGGQGAAPMGGSSGGKAQGANLAGNANGGSATGGSATGGSATGGNAPGGSTQGGPAAGGSAAGTTPQRATAQSGTAQSGTARATE